MPFATFFNLPFEKRDKLINCALDEFAENDYQSASVSKIVQRAGIAKGSLYQYFKDKSDLYFFLLESGTQAKKEIMAACMQDCTDKPFFEVLQTLFEALGQFEIRHPKLARIGYRAANGKSPLPEGLMAQSKQTTRQFFADLLKKGISRGEIRADLNVDMAAYLLATFLADLGNFSGIVINEVGRSQEPVLENQSFKNAFQAVLDIYRNGISSDGSSKEQK